MVDAYSLVFAGMLFTAGTLGDRFGRKGALQVGLLLFLVGTGWPPLGRLRRPMVIGARAVMGLGAAFVMPSTLSILTNVFPPEERPKAIAVWAGIAGGGAAIGPVASGFLLEHFWWGSVFLVNVPVIILALVAGAHPAPDLPRPGGASARHPRRAAVDRRPRARSSTRSSRARTHGWTSPAEPRHLRLRRPSRSASSSCRELHTPNPMLDLRYFQRPALQRVLRRHDAHLLRHVRHVLPRVAVLPARARATPRSSPASSSSRWPS